MHNYFVVIGHITTCKSLVAIISVATKKYFMTIWRHRQIEYLVTKLGLHH
jgi:hypothetical protein